MQEAKGIFSRSVRRLRKVTEYMRGSTRVVVCRALARQLAERMALKEQAALRAVTSNRHVALRHLGQAARALAERGIKVERDCERCDILADWAALSAKRAE